MPALGSTVVALLRNPDQLALLQQDSNLVPAAVEEAMRLRSPFQFMFRRATQDVTIGGGTIRKGETVVVMYGAANRGPRVFDDPDQYRITRPGKHLAFGHGIHFCIGAHLARLESQLALEQLLPLLPRYRLREHTLARSTSLLTFSYSTLDLEPIPAGDPANS
jgi:cytochrome P450